MLVVALSYATVAQGAFYAHQFVPLIALTGLAAILATRAPSSVGALRHPFAGMLLALIVVATASGLVNGALHKALPTIALLGVAVAAFLIAHSARPAEREALATAVVVVGVLAALTGTAGVVLRRQPLALVDEGLWRAASTLTYANATAGLLLLPALIALGRTARASRSTAWPLAGFALVVGLLATLSRGGILALGVGVVVLAAVAGWRVVLARTWPVFAGAAIAFAGILPVMPEQSASRPLLCAAALAAGAGVVVLAGRVPSAVLGTALAVVALVTLVAIPRPGLGLGSSTRVSVSSQARFDGWGAATGVFRQQPVLGAGPGNARYAYVTDEGERLVTRFVHNEYLQLLAELGAVGAVVLAAGLVLSGRRVRRPPPPNDATWAGAVAGLAALGIHSGFDFLWHIPVVVLAAALVAGLVSDHRDRVGAPDAIWAGRPSEGPAFARPNSEVHGR